MSSPSRNWVVLVLLNLCLGGVSCSQESGSQPEDHAGQGHWLGIIVDENGREAYSGLLIERDESGAYVAMVTYLRAGAFYSACDDLVLDGALMSFHYHKGRHDLYFAGELSEDGRTIEGTVVAAEGSNSALKSGTFKLSFSPRAPDQPNAMIFSRTLTGSVGEYTLTITLAETDDGQWVGQIDIPEQSLNRLPLYDMTEVDGVITGMVRLMGPPMVFEMTLSEDMKTLTGTWSGGGTLELDLPRIN